MANKPPDEPRIDMPERFRRAIISSPNFSDGYPLGEIASLIGHANSMGDVFDYAATTDFIPVPADIPLINQASIPIGKDPIAQIDQRILQDFQGRIVELERSMKYWKRLANERHDLNQELGAEWQLAKVELKGLYNICTEYEAQIETLKATIKAMQGIDQVLVPRRIVH